MALAKMLAPRNSRSTPVTILCILAAITVILYYRNSLTPHLTPFRSSAGLTPTNATLGFGALFVVSGPGSPRRARLEQAAAVTGLELTIPYQPTWSDDDVASFRGDDASQSRVGLGSISAWLSHHVVLREFLESGAETALIVEDDVDWDIHLRTQQVPRAQQAARTLSEMTNLDIEQYPWGTPSDWDLLYLGHCGDYFNNLDQGVGVGHNHPDQLARIPHVLYSDPTMPYRTNLHPFTASLLSAFSVPEQTRVLHRSQWPLCTFGYAVTRETAGRVLNDIAPAKEDAQHGLIAYDAAVLAGCRDGGLSRCYTVNPELFHHMEGESIIAELESAERKVFRPPVDAAGYEQLRYRQETSNIGCGFWSGEFYYGEDKERLAFLQEEVGRKGRCLKKGMQDDGAR